ncbi:MAG: nucleotidyltransferase family protein [Clostridiales bacterium]|nr:nucleotidyltransferase family protein [Clostridiales bacterium]
MICIILAAGYATRMYPLTESAPKPLLMVQGKPILNWLLDDIDTIPAIEKILIVSNHKFISHFEAWRKQQRYGKPLTVLDDGSTTNETRIGAVRDILVGLTHTESMEDTLVIAGDNVLEFSLSGFVAFYQQMKYSCVMCYIEPDEERQRKTGIITVDETHRVTSFEEKPQQPRSNLSVPPFYLYTKADLQRIPEAIAEGCSVDAPGSLAAWLSNHSQVYAWPMPGKRYDIGSLAGYEAVQAHYSPTQYK